MQARDIHDVIRRLDDIVASRRAQRDPLVYFPAMYRAVTQRIADDIAAGRFDDGPRMDALDTTFANYYLVAYAAHERGETPSRPWAVAFAHASRSTPGVFQHLLLGMNAHINFDLAQAVVDDPDVAADLPAVRDDYDRINDILHALLDPLQNALAAHVRGGASIDRLLGRLDEGIAGWEITKARHHAWAHAEALAQAPDEGRRDVIRDRMGRFTVDLAERHLIPRFTPTAVAWKLAAWAERTDVAEITASIERVH